MSGNDIRRVAVVGTGVIGASWAAHFLAQGLDVVATDPSPGAEDRLRADVAAHWPILTELGLVDGASTDRLTFTADVETAVGEADFVQENGPERIDSQTRAVRRAGRGDPTGRGAGLQFLRTVAQRDPGRLPGSTPSGC